jgi:cyclophilin family peptidyl-prolyl cis-trans isomerase
MIHPQEESMRRTLLAVTALLLLTVTATAAAPAGKPGATPATAAAPHAKAAPAAPAAPAEPQAVVLQTVLGDIVIRLADAEAPKTTANFRKLVGQGYYDGTNFHRVIPGFMIQGGDRLSKDADPSNDGTGNPGYTIPAEIKLPHVRGAVATARLGDAQNPKRASSGSQFFIDVAPSAQLDKLGFTVFGNVIAGMDVVDRIVAFGRDATLPQANGGGRNPGKKALIKKAYLAPLSQFETK